jgi:flagellin
VGGVTAESAVGGNATNLVVGKALAGTNLFAGSVTGITLDANAKALLGAETFNIAAVGGATGGVTLTGAISGVILAGSAANVLGAQATVFSGTVNGNTVNVQVNYTVGVIGTADVDDAANGLVAGGNLVLQNDAAAQATVQKIDAATTTVGGTYTMSAVNANPTQLSISDGVNPAYLVTVGNLAAGSNTLALGGTGITLTLSASGAESAASVVHDLVGKNITVTGASGGANLQVGANVSTYDEMNISFNDVRASQAGGLNLVNQTVTTVNAPALAANVSIDWSTPLGVGGIVGSNDRAQALIFVVDQSITTLNSRRATLGASQNRLEHTVNSLGVSVENLTASESRIRDADVASLSTQLVSSQILSQAGTAVLSQANQASQSVLSLLR